MAKSLFIYFRPTPHICQLLGSRGVTQARVIVIFSWEFSDAGGGLIMLCAKVSSPNYDLELS